MSAHGIYLYELGTVFLCQFKSKRIISQDIQAINSIWVFLLHPCQHLLTIH